MSDNAEKGVADFLSRVVPWPQPGAPGFINVHWTSPSHKGMGGKPFTELADALSFIEWAKSHPAVIKDLYFCLSLQAKTGPTRNGKPTALRKRDNAVALKAIWLDIDCNKEPPKGYRCKEDGLKALREFCDATRTRYPTAIINSGNGLHVYWISDKPLSAEEWLAYAEGLDALATQHGLFHDSITTDAARVLRVPETFNNKQVPPKPVEIKLLEADLSFASALSHLRKANAEEHPPARPRKRARVKDVEDVVVDQAVFEGEPAAAFKDLPPDEFKLNGYDIPPLPFKPIQEGCPFFADAYETHGKEHAQPLWHLTVLAATFLEDGEELAHELGKEHPDYAPDTTQEMWERKVKEREELGLGWPGCKAFEDAGCTFCKTCQHHGKIKSPLNLAVPAIIKNALDRIMEEVKDGKIDPVVALKKLHRMGADNETMFSVLNANYAVVKYGSETLVASIIGNDIIVMKVRRLSQYFCQCARPGGKAFRRNKQGLVQLAGQAAVFASRHRVRAGW